jgi:2-keto-3-deoxy-galactonokinase
MPSFESNIAHADVTPEEAFDIALERAAADDWLTRQNLFNIWYAYQAEALGRKTRETQAAGLPTGAEMSVFRAHWIKKHEGTLLPTDISGDGPVTMRVRHRLFGARA